MTILGVRSYTGKGEYHGHSTSHSFLIMIRDDKQLDFIQIGIKAISLGVRQNDTMTLWNNHNRQRKTAKTLNNTNVNTKSNCYKKNIYTTVLTTHGRRENTRWKKVTDSEKWTIMGPKARLLNTWWWNDEFNGMLPSTMETRSMKQAKKKSCR